MDRRDYYFRQIVLESELDDGFDGAENADHDMAIDWAFSGVNTGLVVQEQGTPDLTVQVTAGVAYDAHGQRVHVPAAIDVDVSVDHLGVTTAVSTGGNSRIVSVFLLFDRSLTDPRIDGNSATVYFVRSESYSIQVVAGAEAVSPSAPALDPDAVLLADITLVFGQTSVLNADIELTNRRQDAFVSSGSPIAIRETTVNATFDAIVAALNDHINNVGYGHPATAISYAGGGNWADGSTNPATSVELQLDKIVDDLAGTAGATRVGFTTATAWLGGGTLSASTLYEAIVEILTDLASQTASDDGSEKIGAQVKTGYRLTMPAGSARSQLDYLFTLLDLFLYTIHAYVASGLPYVTTTTYPTGPQLSVAIGDCPAGARVFVWAVADLGIVVGSGSAKLVIQNGSTTLLEIQEIAVTGGRYVFFGSVDLASLSAVVAGVMVKATSGGDSVSINDGSAVGAFAVRFS